MFVARANFYEWEHKMPANREEAETRRRREANEQCDKQKQQLTNHLPSIVWFCYCCCCCCLLARVCKCFKCVYVYMCCAEQNKLYTHTRLMMHTYKRRTDKLIKRKGTRLENGKINDQQPNTCLGNFVCVYVRVPVCVCTHDGKCLGKLLIQLRDQGGRAHVFVSTVWSITIDRWLQKQKN